MIQQGIILDSDIAMPRLKRFEQFLRDGAGLQRRRSHRDADFDPVSGSHWTFPTGEGSCIFHVQGLILVS